MRKLFMVDEATSGMEESEFTTAMSKPHGKYLAERTTMRQKQQQAGLADEMFAALQLFEDPPESALFMQ